MINKIICIIPVRGGSKSIKNKNIISFRGKPLVVNGLLQAIKSNLFEKIVVASDNTKYFNVIKKYTNSKKIIFFKRSKKSSTDYAKTEIVLNEVLHNYQNYRYACLVQATSPLIKSQDLKKGFQKYKRNNYDSIFSCYEKKIFVWKESNKNMYPLNYNYLNRPMRQKAKKNFIENGAFYIFKINKYKKYKNRLFGKIGHFLMPEERSLDINEYSDINK